MAACQGRSWGFAEYQAQLPVRRDKSPEQRGVPHADLQDGKRWALQPETSGGKRQTTHQFPSRPDPFPPGKPSEMVHMPR